MPSIDPSTEFAQQLGRQLRQAREAAGMSAEAVCTRLKLHMGIVQALEAGDWKRLGAPVYVRGQLRSYGHLLGVSLANADEHLDRLQQHITTQPARHMVQAPLLPQERGRRMRPLLLYGLGGVLLAAVVWMLLHWSPGDTEPVSASLDIPPPVVEPSATTTTPVPLAALPSADTADVAAPDPQADTTTASAAELSTAPATADAAALTLRARSDSWLELYAPDGQVLEQTLLRAGEVRHLARGQVGRVVIGNAAGVEVLRGGAVQDMAPFQRANVARFAVSFDGTLTRSPN